MFDLTKVYNLTLVFKKTTVFSYVLIFQEIIRLRYSMYTRNDTVLVKDDTPAG